MIAKAFDVVELEDLFGLDKFIVRNFKTYNPQTHELVEKKEAKINRLNKEINKNALEIEAIQETIIELSKKKSELIKQNKEKEEELKQLK